MRRQGQTLRTRSHVVSHSGLTLCDMAQVLSALLHILKDGRYLADFDLQPGSHLLGISDNADLMLSDELLTSDVCYVEVTGDGQVIDTNGARARDRNFWSSTRWRPKVLPRPRLFVRFDQ